MNIKTTKIIISNITINAYQMPEFSNVRLIANGSTSKVYSILGTNLVIKMFFDAKIAARDLSFINYLNLHKCKAVLTPVDYCLDSQSYIIMKRMTPINMLPFETITLRDKINCIISIAQCVDGIHSLGVVHNDITLNNILYDPITLSIKIIDFSSSFFEGHEQINCTTPRYASPENIKSKSSDIWAFGIILKHINSCNNTFIDNLIKSCLQEDPKCRPSIKDILKLLHRYIIH